MKTMYSPVAVALLFIAVSFEVDLPCPYRCTCEKDYYYTNIDCKNKGLTVCPSYFPTRSSYIYLQDNQITTVQQGAFQNLEVLFSIYLQDNEITLIEQGAFQNLSNLGKIYLQDNEITTIEQGAFQNLRGLYKIYLQNNLITAVNGTLQGLTSLSYV
ncbi:unnamed protein product [Mytilus coruscus]|uniref:LRRNT domain-containing protein n=1 Tax=Mytilus coruscus TaxID=42192 RepID=A0A6J8DL36_MYTCO|nr:unnamed protein product [Mytilus coruscus]